MLAVGGDGEQFELVTVEAEGPVVIAIADDLKRSTDDRAVRIEVELEPDLRHQPIGRTIVLAVNGGVGWRGGFGSGADVHARGLRRRRAKPQPGAPGSTLRPFHRARGVHPRQWLASTGNPPAPSRNPWR